MGVCVCARAHVYAFVCMVQGVCKLFLVPRFDLCVNMARGRQGAERACVQSWRGVESELARVHTAVRDAGVS